MNIGIITFHSAHNYGAMLQTFALQTYLKKELEINVKVIDFRTEAGIQAYEIFKRPNTLRQYFRELLKLLHYKELKNGYDSFPIIGWEYDILRTNKDTENSFYMGYPIGYWMTATTDVFEDGDSLEDLGLHPLSFNEATIDCLERIIIILEERTNESKTNKN